ncbi:MAG: hypothetical protein OWQ48_03415 [Desulfurococcus sp.]|nr:hypothetical protein [Desulfurococcus sp.]
MKKGRFVLEAGRRITALLLVYDALVLLNVYHGKPFDAVFAGGYSAAGIIVMVLAGLTFVAGSLTLYMLSLSVLVLLSAVEGLIPLYSIAGLLVMLVLDTLLQVYRGGEVSWIGLDYRGVLKSLASVTAVCTPILLLIALTIFLTMQVFKSILGAASRVVALNPLLSPILNSRFFTIVLTVALLVYLYSIFKLVIDIALTVMIPSRSSVLEELLDESSINKVFAIPFTWILRLPVVFLVYPAIYAILHGVYLPVVLDNLPATAITSSQYFQIAVDYAIGLVAFTLSAMTVKWLMDWVSLLGELNEGVKPPGLTGILAPPLLIYVSAVILSLEKGVSLLAAVFNPDVAGLSSLIASGYSDMGALIISLVSDLLRMLGALP